MINLLPPEIKSSYDYASRNVHALHWLVAFAIAFVGLIAIGTTGLIYMNHLAKNNEAQIATKQDSLRQQRLKETQAEAKDISNSLKLAVDVLGKEVLFSKLLTQLGSVTPDSVRLSELTISETTGAIDISGTSATFDAASQLQVNLNDPDNKIFRKAEIIGVNCASQSDSANYPCTLTIRALFADDNPFLFINAKGQ